MRTASRHGFTLLEVALAVRPGATGLVEGVRAAPRRTERELVQQALQASGGSRREAADLLGVSLRTLFYKLRRYRLE